MANQEWHYLYVDFTLEDAITPTIYITTTDSNVANYCLFDDIKLRKVI